VNLDAHHIAILQRFQAILADVEGIEAVRVGATDLKRLPPQFEANILPLPDFNNPVDGQGADDWPGETLAAPIIYIITYGVAIEVVRRGDDMLSAMQLAANCRAAIEADEQLGSMVDSLTYETTQLAAGKPDQQSFVLVAPIFNFTYRMARGGNTRITG